MPEIEERDLTLQDMFGYGPGDKVRRTTEWHSPEGGMREGGIYTVVGLKQTSYVDEEAYILVEGFADFGWYARAFEKVEDDDA